MIRGLTFDAELHRYHYQGRPVVNVTRVLDDMLRDLRGVRQELLAAARETGELVHKATELDAMGALDAESVDPTIEPYMKAWRRFRYECNPTFISNEEHVYHRTYDFAGTLDHHAQIGGEEGIIDKKTSEPDLIDAVQLSAYYAAKFPEDGARFRRMWGLYLRADGTYRLRKYEDHFHVFIAALTCYRFKNGRE